MKTFILHILCLSFFMCLLIFPNGSLEGAKNGLLLWYTILLPTLLPFIICTNLLVGTNAFSLLVKLLGLPLRKLFGLTDNGSFPVIIGFLCGYPMGAKVSSDLYRDGYISKNEASYLLSFCNNPSPVFIISVLVTQILGDTNLLWITLGSLMLAPCIVSFFTRRYYKFDTVPTYKNEKKIHLDLSILDNSIMDGIQLIVKIGGYVVLFSILIAFANELPYSLLDKIKFLLPYLECTNGLGICNGISDFTSRYLAMLSVISFGGICAITQTNCLLIGTDLKIFPYVITKIITAILTVIIGYILLVFCY